MQIEIDAETLTILERVVPGINAKGVEDLVRIVLRRFAEQAERTQSV